MKQIDSNPNLKQKPNIFKFIIFTVIIIAVFGIIIYLGLFSGEKGNMIVKKESVEEKEVVMTITGENKIQTYSSFIIDEWNGYRFKYRSDWSVEKNYNADGSFSGITIFSQNRKDNDNSIFIGKEKTNCEDVKMVKCLMAGYGLIMQPIYTYSNDTETAVIYEGVVKSINDFQGQSEFDIEKIHNTINIFIEAEKTNNFNKAKEIMSAELLNTYDSRLFGVIRDGKVGRHEFVENAKYLGSGYYQIPTKVYGYLTEERNEIGYWNYIFKIKIINGKYLINDITIDNFQSK
ncbi:MAG: hypothetical protein PHR47_03985 [Candidatus Pacebacteria bacterium]|nr:hypothetical protein [Candidatus Paceibacterota bacterium]